MTATYIVVPPEIVEKIVYGKRPPVEVTLNRHNFRTTIAPMGGQFRIGISAEHRTAASVEAGEENHVTLKYDTSPRDAPIPADLHRPLQKSKLLAKFQALAPSHRKEHIRHIEESKKPETRLRRIEKTIAALQPI